VLVTASAASTRIKPTCVVKEMEEVILGVVVILRPFISLFLFLSRFLNALYISFEKYELKLNSHDISKPMW
jgi:hypothetical protein